MGGFNPIKPIYSLEAIKLDELEKKFQVLGGRIDNIEDLDISLETLITRKNQEIEALAKQKRFEETVINKIDNYSVEKFDKKKSREYHFFMLRLKK